METSLTSFFASQQDDELAAITCPEFSIWDVGIDHISYIADSPKVEIIGFRDNEEGKIPQGQLKEIIGDGTANMEVKKMAHKEIERQRRQEMATLYASLRSVLPSPYIRGKRSTSDQIHEATKYIRCLQNNIRELGIKRKNMKRSSNIEVLGSEKGNCSSILPIVVTVQPCSVGVEILITANGITFPLSRLLQMLLEDGLNAVCCIRTEVDGRLHYMIQSEVIAYPGVLNLQMLQTKLISNINTLTDIKH